MTRDAIREAPTRRFVAYLRKNRTNGMRADILCLKAADRIDALLAENAALRRALEWRPISEAPKDGTYILVEWKSLHERIVDKARWITENYGQGHFVSGFDIAGHYFIPPADSRTPTRWLPLPTPPAGGAHG